MNFQKVINKNIAKVGKRTRFVITSFILALLILFSTFFSFDKAFIFVPVFIVASYALTYFSILEGIEKMERVMLFIMPIFFTIAFYLFYFLFPIRWLTRLPFFIIYLVSLYAILLVSNIFNVGAQKSLQLFRAAFSINFFYQIFVIFLILNVFFSLKLGFLLNGLGVLLILLPLNIQFLWSVKPSIQLKKDTILLSFLVVLVCSELSLVLSFIPIRTSIFALFLSTCYYSLSGIIYAYLDERLFKETIREYLIVLAFVVVVVFLTVSW